VEGISGAEMEDSEIIRESLEEKLRVLAQLEGVYKTSTSNIQKKRVAREIREVKRIISILKSCLEDEDISIREKSGKEEQGLGLLPHLNQIPVARYREDSRDREIDTVTSYMKFFEDNYLPILSEYYVKLDFSHSLKRDTFYPKYMEVKKILNDYNHELDVLYREEYDNIALYRDKSIVHKIRQRYLFTISDYFSELCAFLCLLIDDFETGGSIIINPDEVISLNEFIENRKLDGYSVIDALKEIYEFGKELRTYLGLPEI